MITADNLKVLQSALKPFDAALVSSPSNRFYLTGMQSSAGFILITNDKLIFLTDFRYIEAAKNSIEGFLITEQKGNPYEQINSLLIEAGAKKLYIETEYFTLALLQKLKTKLIEIEVSESDEFENIISGMRRIKNESEIKLIKNAAIISEKALIATLPKIKPGVSEREIAAELEYQMKLFGADGIAFDTIAVAGQNSSKPHGVPGEYKLCPGDFLTIDFGAKYKGYCSDMTRTFSVGQPDENMRKVYNTVLDAQIKALENLKSGAVCSEIDKIARDIIYSAGYEGCFGHGLGHSVGIDIHEEPRLSPVCSAVLEPGMIMTVEPGIYIEGSFGVRIEDTVVLTDVGVENFNFFTKELIIL